MSLLKKLLVAVTAIGVLAAARAEMVAQVPNLHTPALTDSGSYFVSGDSNRYSFADIVNLPAGAEQRLVQAKHPAWLARLRLNFRMSPIQHPRGPRGRMPPDRRRARFRP
jgi:hypothetical protein